MHPSVVLATEGSMRGTRDSGEVLTMDPASRTLHYIAHRACGWRGLWEATGVHGKGSNDVVHALTSSNHCWLHAAEACGPPSTCKGGTRQCQSAQEAREAGTCPSGIMETIEFERRLESLRNQTSAAAASKQEPERSGSVPNYDSPPPLLNTLLNKAPEAEGEYKSIGGGPPKVLLAVASVAIGAIFILTSVDFGGGSPSGPSTSSSASRPEQTLTGPERSALEAALEQQQVTLSSNPQDVKALEAAATIAGRLGDFRAAAASATTLTEQNPGDPAAWQLLGECQEELGDGQAAETSYVRGWEAGGRKDLLVLGRLTTLLSKQGRHEQALERIDSAPPSVLSSLDAQLARGRVLASWPGHSLDAKHLYDGLIEAHPDDARPMLAKGLLLRQQGRGVDADRAFLQARALVPPEQRAGLDAVIGR
ncbi:CGL74 [Auxenochlorella protothecoides x Auxenochlorella symbiontica]